MFSKELLNAVDIYKVALRLVIFSPDHGVWQNIMPIHYQRPYSSWETVLLISLKFKNNFDTT